VAEETLSLGPFFLGDKPPDHLQALDLMSPSCALAAPRALEVVGNGTVKG